MAFLFNLSPDRVNVPKRDWSGIEDLATRYQQGQADARTGQAVDQFAQGLDPETAKQVAPLLRDPQTRKYGMEIITSKMKGADLPGAVQEYQFAQQQGYGGSFADWEQSKRKAGANSTTINMGEGSKFYDKLDEKNAEQVSSMFDVGMNAQRSAPDIDRLGTLLETTPQGSVGALKARAGEWGINTDGLDDIQATTAIINRMVPAQRPAGSGPMSDRDIELFKSSLPRIINQPGGNQKIMGTLKAINKYDQDAGRIAGRLANREITPEQYRTELQKLQNPLAGFNAAPDGAPAAGGAARPASKAEYDALPPGTQFVAPDGSMRVKP